MKTIVLMVSKVFPAYHPMKGEPTNFKEKILSGEKIHTIRGNYDLWKKRIGQVLSGEAYLSLRQWEGKPYHSKQEEFKQLKNYDFVGVQEVHFLDGYAGFPYVDGKKTSSILIAQNDGLRPSDFTQWFTNYDTEKPMAIIQFTGFRY